MKKKSIFGVKSYIFAIRIVRLSQYLLQQEKKEFVLNRQVLRSATASALVKEAEYARSDAGFINKFGISLKEVNEAGYCLSLLKDTDYMDSKLYENSFHDCAKLISMLVSTIKAIKNRNLIVLNS
ncbi:MAG: four helix bundle protein [Dysgonamonadaceae bacterium]|jgi:four helix bundle protein|nr:four helix bundle protein [Dysgonamonadaceae bacterium]